MPVLQHAAARTPLLLLILGSPPPVSVRVLVRLSVIAAVEVGLRGVLKRTTADFDATALLEQVPEVCCWLTWTEIAEVVTAQLEQLRCDDPSLRATVSRLASAVTDAVRRHT